MDAVEHINENIVETDFSARDLTGHVFEDCSFSRCVLRDANLARTRFSGCSFTGCDLSNATFANARVRDATFESCKLLGVQWVRLENLLNPSFTECQLDYCNFSALKLRKTRFHKCSLRDTDFSQAELAECDFREANLLNARFHGSSLLKADFRGALNYLIDPIANQVRGARFSLPEAQGLLAGLGVVIE